MSEIIVEYLRMVHPVTLAAAYIPLLAAAAVWIFFYLRYDRRILKKLALTFKRIAEGAEYLTECSLENLRAMDADAMDSPTPEFEAAWMKMMSQVERRYTEDIFPEAGSFFKEAPLITVPGHRGSIRTIWCLSALLMLLSVFLPPIVENLLTGYAGEAASVAGRIPAGLILAGQLLFTMIDRSVLSNTIEAYQRFLFLFDTVLPTADVIAGPALILAASRKNQEAFREAAEDIKEAFSESALKIAAAFSDNSTKISKAFSENTSKIDTAFSDNMSKIDAAFTEKTDIITAAFSENTAKIAAAIDEFSNGGVLPALHNAMQELTAGYIAPALDGIKATLNQTLDQIVKKQEDGIRELTDSFANRLAGTLELRINNIAENLAQYHDRMENQNTLYQERIDSLNGLLIENMQKFTESMEAQKNILGKSAEVLSQAEDIYRSEAEITANFNEHEGKMLEITKDFHAQTEKFAKEAMAFVQENAKAQLSFGEVVNAITDQLQDALTGAGREIADGINRAVVDNAQAIADLTVQAQALREDYEKFFQRREDSTQLMLEEMDYQIQGLITRMSEDVGEMLKKTVEENGSILSQYKDQTGELLQSFDEQARSMGLYAQEIKMDISELSQNLTASVEEFNEKIKEGVQTTFSDFDRGFAGLAARIANTVESIADAVENLPASIKGGR